MNNKAFGYELLVDCYKCKAETCDDIALCYDFLDKLVEFIGMEKQGEPAIFRTDEQRFPGKDGLSGWVPLAESSIVIHTLSLNNYISLDVYSCKEFNTKKVIEFIKTWFSPEKIDSQFIKRGTKYFDKI